MAPIKTPDVYIVENNASPNSVVEASTAIPAFIGITEKAVNGADSLSNKPWKITSMTEFQQYFGGAPAPKFELSVAPVAADDANKFFYCFTNEGGKTALKVSRPTMLYTLYYNMVMFFANGGGRCYIVSVGTYAKNDAIDKEKTGMALVALEKKQEITMVLVPEAVNTNDCKDIQRLVIGHCGKMMNRLAIFDVQPKATVNETKDEQIKTFRANIGEDFLSYGTAYYPWLNTSVISNRDIDETILTWDYTQNAPDLIPFFGNGSKFPEYFKTAFAEIKNRATAIKEAAVDNEGKKTSPAVTETGIPDELALLKNSLHNALLQNLPGYQSVVDKVKDLLNRLPPSAAMAGLYTMVDNTRGVWKAPANISVNFVNSPTESIDNAMQEDLSVPMSGKAMNTIRNFPGDGIRVWGARTLDGNSLDWRYVNVRRTMMFLQESVKNTAKTYMSEPNVASTWRNVRSMIGSFLLSIWKRGGLVGSSPEDAYGVHVGLGDTMTADDILNGIMRITVFVAIVRPAEFTEITFQQQMQKS